MDEILYFVVKNHEEQYSIWPSQKELPLGWIDCGVLGSKGYCLDHIEKIWTDLRPASARAT
ncbi:MAG TPA: MbtH family NRPS accessory protein [Cellvibrio sp.]|nr:MbtH family NRPS accessory protein [Cellvibrio sp.]